MALDWASLAFLANVITNPADIFSIFLILSLTVNLEFGYTGIPNFGKVLFVTVGAFLAGSLSYRLMVSIMGLKAPDILLVNTTFLPRIDTALGQNVPLAVGLTVFMLVIGAVFGGLVGFLSSYPAIRLKEDYLGMLLLASGEFFNLFGQTYYPFLGGTQGLTAPDPVFDVGLEAAGSDQLLASTLPNLAVLVVLVIFAVLTYLYAERIGRSPLGRVLRAVRDNEVASEALGKDNVAIRRNVLIVGSALSGVAGVLYIFVFPYIAPGPSGTFTRQTFTFIPFVIVVLGGASNNRGVLLGAFVYMVIIETLGQTAVYLNGIGIAVAQTLITRMQASLVGILLIVILLYRPDGLIREKPTLTMARLKLKSIADTLKDEPPK